MKVKPLLLDLACGRGGWAHGFIKEGWRVIGVDLHDFSSVYPGEFIQADLLTWKGWLEIDARAVVASPPCEEFSRHAMPWLRAKNPPEPSLALINRCFAIAAVKRLPITLENVRAAQWWIGRSVDNCGPFHLWGDVPHNLPAVTVKKQNIAGQRRDLRAMIPEELSRYIARYYLRGIEQRLF